MPNLINRYYPKISSLVSFEKLPEFLSFLSSFAEEIFDKIYFKDLQFFKSEFGDSAWYNLDIVSRDRLDVEIPGTGIFISLNPDVEDNQISSTNLSISYSWPILAYLRRLNLSEGSPDLQQLFNLGLDITRLSEYEFAVVMLELFVDSGGDETERINQCVEDLNDGNDPSDHIIIQDPSNYSITSLLNDIEEVYETSSYIVFFLQYLNDDDLEIFKSNFEKLFNALFSKNDFEAYVRELIIPKIDASVKLSTAIEFPRNILLPLDPVSREPLEEIQDTDGNATGTPRVGFLVDGATFHASTERGIYVEKDLSGSMTHPARIGNTGFTIDIQGVKIDINDDRNIAEADLDGRPNSFKGVYVKKAVIGLPPFVNPQSGNVELFSTDLLIGNEGGISGVIGARSNAAGIEEELLEICIIDGESDEPSGIVVNHEEGKVKVSGFVEKDSEVEGEDPEKIKFREYDFEYDPDGTEDLYIRDAKNRFFKVDHTDGAISPVTYEPGPLHFDIGNSTLELTEFTVVFKQGQVIAGSIAGTWSNPNFKDENGNPVHLEIGINVQDGFLIEFKVPEGNAGLAVINSDAFKLFMSELYLGEQSQLWKFGIICKIENDTPLPVLDKLLPNEIDIRHFNFTEGLPADFDISAVWDGGMTISGTDEGGLGGIIPLNLNILNTFKLNQVKFQTFSPPEGLDIKMEFIGAAIELGPIYGEAMGMGYIARIRENTDNEGNFGRTAIEFEFIKPTGILIDVDAGKVSGGGSLNLDHVNQRYSGHIKLKIGKKIDVIALGLLAKNVPGHPDMNSFLAMINMTLPKAIQVGFGFELIEVGGIVGIHRDMDTDAIRQSVRTGALDNVLFPDDPEENVPQIINDMEAIFPVEYGRHSFALMGKFENGDAVTMEMGFLLSLPSPLKIGLAGLVKVEVDGEAGKKIIDMRALFAVLLDFELKLFSADVSLYNSQIAGVVVNGDIALRYSWGDFKYFALAVGGFHPEFQEADTYGLSGMARISMAIKNTDKTRVLGMFYVAVTSNTFQFGAHIDIYKKLGPLSVELYFGMDVLFAFNPFKFIIGLQLGAEIKFKKFTLVGAHLGIELRGPKPYHIKGYAEVKLGPFQKKVRLDITIGDEDNEQLNAVELVPILINELEKESTYRALEDASAKDDAVIYINSGTESEVILNPQDTLLISQPAVPLGIKVNKYGESPTTAQDKFQIKQVTVGNDLADISEDSRDFFAPNQFVKASDTEKLKANSFEELKSGVVVGGDIFGTKIPLTNSSRELSYEQKYRDNPNGNIEALEMTYDLFDRTVKGGAIRKSSAFKKEAKRKKHKGVKLRMKTPDYGVVYNSDVRLRNSSSKGMTRTEAEDAVADLIAQSGINKSVHGARPAYEYRPVGQVMGELEEER